MKSKQVKILILGILGLSSWNIYGQSSETNYAHPKQYLPASPDVMAFNKISHVPVGLFTGSSNISIPLTSIKMSDYEFPISINYNSSGIKVEELASSVGLGWSLNAYGNISVGVNGIADFSQYGFARLASTEFKLPDDFLTNHLSYIPQEYQGGAMYRLGLGSAEGSIDTQPDIYSYSFNGNSGKFYFDQYGQAHTIPFNGFKIEQSNFGNNFSITDLKGIKYTFNEFESSTLLNTCGPESFLNPTMLLTDVFHPNGSSIKFEYLPVRYTQKIQAPLSRRRDLSGSFPEFDCTNTITDLSVDSRAISRIISSDGTEVKFYYGADRRDLPGTKVLERVEVRKSDVIQNTNFFYSYFSNDRLKLDSVKNNNGGVYLFRYNELVNLPARLSFSQDHWGYYNGKNNANLLPVDPEYDFLDGANREVDSNYVQANILTRITYPSKGFTDFVYESNDYYSEDPIIGVSTHNYSLYSDRPQVVTFTIPSDAIVKNAGITIGVNGSSSGGGGIGNEPEGDEYFLVSVQGNDGYEQTFTAYRNQNLGIAFTPGVTYSMQFSNLGTIRTNVKAHYDLVTKKPFKGNRLAGGVRLRVQKSYSDLTDLKPLVESYTYAVGAKSSGIIGYKPRYTYYLEKYSWSDNLGTYLLRKSYVQNSNSVDPLSTLQGGSINYPFVSKIQSFAGERIRTDSEFSYYSSNNGAFSYPLRPVISMDWANGLLLKEISYKNRNGTLVPLKEIRNSYSIQNEDVFWNSHFLSNTKPSLDMLRGIGYVIAFFRPPSVNGLITNAANFSVNSYRLESKWIRQDSSVSVLFDDQNNSVKTNSVFNYGDLYNFKPTRIMTTNSNGKTKSNLLYYVSSIPDNLKNLETAKLISQHRLSQIIFSSDSLGLGKNIDQRLVFKDFGNSKVNLSKVYVKNGSSDEYQKLEILLYDSYGNVREFKDLANSSNVYLWGYGGQYPIAEIKNASYTDVVAVLTQPVIDNLNGITHTEAATNTLIENAMIKLRTDTKLAKAMVTSYTYKPLVGMTSKTDPRGITEYYEYDGMQRLKAILDQVKNVTTSMDYHYRTN
ncbi:hypothetical protein [Sphingobacterium anhuiense]|uniref:hypothetical protein n=1 Tax=Sphingobacterium anhuiense TaxID=493780 RepID=UPI003C2F4F43